MLKEIFLFTFINLSAVAFSSEDNGTRFEYRDFKVLHQENNYQEFISHYSDLRPSLKTPEFNQWLKDMAYQYIDQIDNFSHWDQLEKLGQDYSLSQDLKWQTKKSLLAEKLFIKYPPKNKQEKKRLIDFWKTTSRDIDVGIKLFTLVDQEDKWLFIEPAVNDKNGMLYCQNEIINQEIFSQLQKNIYGISLNTVDDFFKNPKTDELNYKNLLYSIIGASCAPHFKNYLLKNLASVELKGIGLELTINLLRSLKAFNQEEDSAVLISYLLNGPVVGNLLNNAWSEASRLGLKYSEREKVLSYFKSLKILPDETFLNLQSERSFTIVNHLALHFPEILNFYGEVCAKHLNKKTSAEETPIHSSLSCQHFLKVAKEKSRNWVRSEFLTGIKL